MLEQICALLALTGGLFANVPLEQMHAAEQAVHKAAMEIPDALRRRFAAGEKLNEADHVFILQIAQKVIAPFQINSSPPIAKK